LLSDFDANNNYATDPSGDYIEKRSKLTNDIKKMLNTEDDSDKS